jgi:exopolysaccharide production protein ExoY
MKNFDDVILEEAGLPAWKRALDVGLILLALPILIPVVLAICGMICFVSKGPILYKQDRVGRGGRKFLCYKFRTMHVGADSASHQGHLQQLIHSDAPMTKMDARGDKRIIPGGVLLRATGLDELPQLINVLKGEMSIVGPRPCLPYEAEHYLPWQRGRFNATPGLTGLWQVSGKNKTTFTEMIRLDIEYSRRTNPWLDLEIIFKTIPVLVLQALETSQKKKTAKKKIAVQSETIFPAHATHQ